MKRSTTNQNSVKLKRVLLVPIIAVVGLFPVSQAFADPLEDQIRQLQTEVNSFQAQAGQLRAEADTLQNALRSLTAEKNAIQAQLDLTQAKLDKLNADITANQQKMTRQQSVLSETISDLAAEGTTSPIELLASSGSIGDFIDRQGYRSSVQLQIESSIKQVKAIKIELAKQKQLVEITLNDQKGQRDQLASKEAEQAQLLAATQGQEAQYRQMASQKSSEIAAKRAAQAAAMRARGGGSGISYGSTSYPWGTNPSRSDMAYNDYCQYYDGRGSAVDDWGYCKWQCVSHVAWKLATDGRGNSGFRGLGHAMYWRYAGTGVVWNDLQPGDVIVEQVGGYGHVMYVEWVSGGQVGISQMNVPYDSGRYSTDTYSMSRLQSGGYDARRFH